MFQGSIGRLASRILAPAESLPLYVYVDAGGHTNSTRLWGGLVAVGDAEDAWLQEALETLRKRNLTAGLPTGELKGSALADQEIEVVRELILADDHRIQFWANWYPEATDPDVVRIEEHFIAEIRALRVDRLRLDAPAIQARYRRMASYLNRLKGINRHKLLSALAHLGWLISELKRVGLGPQVGSVQLAIDREDLPFPGEAADLLKLHLAASLQAVGMSTRLTGKALREGHAEGAVAVDVHADSRHVPGVQVADILLQPVQRRLPTYGDRTSAPSRLQNTAAGSAGEARSPRLSRGA